MRFRHLLPLNCQNGCNIFTRDAGDDGRQARPADAISVQPSLRGLVRRDRSSAGPMLSQSVGAYDRGTPKTTRASRETAQLSTTYVRVSKIVPKRARYISDFALEARHCQSLWTAPQQMVTVVSHLENPFEI